MKSIQKHIDLGLLSGNHPPLESFTDPIPDTPFTQKFLSEYVGVATSDQPKLQAVNYMLDQEIWGEYMSTNNKSDYAFGGPTLPLFKASYNDICKEETKLDCKKSGAGYMIKKGTGNWANGEGGYGDTTTQKGMYFKGNDGSSADSAWALWLASPNAQPGDGLMYANYKGYMFINALESSSLGFRPVISLKSDVQLIDNKDGTYTIK